MAHKSVQRPIRLGHYVIPGVGLAAFAVLILIAIALYQWVPGWANDHTQATPHIDQLGNAGQFFSLIFGIPLAFITLLLGIAGVWHFNSSRDEVEILRFFEEKILTPLGIHLQRITDEVQSLMGAANACRGMTHENIERFIERTHQSDLYMEDIVASVDGEDRDVWDRAVVEIRNHIDVWVREYLNMLSHTYETALASDRIDELLAEEFGTPVQYLRTVVPRELHRRIWLEHHDMDLGDGAVGAVDAVQARVRRSFADDPRELCRDLARLAELSTVNDAVIGVSSASPDGQTTVEYLGALLGVNYLELAEPKVAGDTKIKGYWVNFGAAILLTLFQYLPERGSLYRSFARTYGTRSSLSLRFLATSGPEPRQFLSDGVYQSLAAQFGHWQRLVIVETDGGRTWYDRNRHGPIPSTGYRSDEPGSDS